MSADGWKICPRCRAVIQNAKDTEIMKASESYGKIDKDEYLELVRKAAEPARFEETLREDYEFYLDEEYVLKIRYYAGCNKCNFEFSFLKEIDIESEASKV